MTLSADVETRARLSLGTSAEPIYRTVAALLAERQVSGVLVDVGCGTGNLRRALGLRFARYVGADVVRYDGFPGDGEFYPIDIATGRPVSIDAEPDALRLTDHHEVDLGPSVADAISLAEPIAPLHDPNCQGLCVECGLPLDEGTHDHPTDDIDPRLDYGRCSRDNRHAFASSTNATLWKGLGAGMVFRRYSGYPVNETTGVDTNGDGTNNDRPVRGRDDATLPIRSAVDSRGMAVRNGLDGQPKLILDGRVQYVWRIQQYQAGLFLEIYNLTNHTNFGDPTGARNSANFMIPIVADNPRTAQLGFRLTF